MTTPQKNHAWRQGWLASYAHLDLFPCCLCGHLCRQHQQVSTADGARAAPPFAPRNHRTVWHTTLYGQALASCGFGSQSLALSKAQHPPPLTPTLTSFHAACVATLPVPSAFPHNTPICNTRVSQTDTTPLPPFHSHTNVITPTLTSFHAACVATLAASTSRSAQLMGPEAPPPPLPMHFASRTQQRRTNTRAPPALKHTHCCSP
jgi:hypothetical protein